VANLPKEALGAPAQVSAHDLSVIPIQLNLEPRMFHCLQDHRRLFNRSQIVTGKVTIVDWLDEKVQISCLTKHKFEVGKERRSSLLWLDPLGYSRHYVQTRHRQNICILERLIN
jgi:hypothetical protein